MKRATVSFSGGADSVAAVRWALQHDYSVRLLTLRTGWKVHEAVELPLAHRLAERLALPLEVLDVRPMIDHFREGDAPLVLPFGGAVFMSVSVMFALARGCEYLIKGSNAEDAMGDYDYSRGCADRFETLVKNSVGKPLNILLPFAQMSKAEVVRSYLDAPDLFAETFSCVRPVGTQHCGVCPTCQVRRRAAVEAGLEDRTVYVNG